MSSGIATVTLPTTRSTVSTTVAFSAHASTNPACSYFSQVLYGCKSAHCTTSTCLSFNKRLATKPHRPPTQLTARVHAYYLASQDHPHRGLCPHELKVDPKTLSIEDAHGVIIRSEQQGSGQTCDVYPRPKPSASTSINKQANTTVDHNGRVDECGNAARLAQAVAERHQTKKDSRSLAQNLFDTATMIYFYSKNIPTPKSVFTSLWALQVPAAQSLVKPARNDPIAGPKAKRSVESSHGVYTENFNGHAVAVIVNRGDTPAGSSSQPSDYDSTQSFKPNVEQRASVPNNGQYVYKVRHVPELAENVSLRRPSNPFSLDSVLESTQKTKSETKMQDEGVNHMHRSENGISLSNPNAQQANTLSESPERVALPVVSYLTCGVMEQLKEDVYYHCNEQSSDSRFITPYDTNGGLRRANSYVNRSLFFTLSDPETLLKSFRDEPNKSFASSPLPHLDSYRLTNAFQDWDQRNGALIFDSLYMSVEALFRPPPELNVQDSDPTGRYLSDEEAAHIAIICVHALTSLIPKGWPHTWVQIRKFRGWGVVLPGAPQQTDIIDGFAHPWLNIIDQLEYEPALRLANRLLHGIAARLCFEKILSPSTSPTAFVDIMIRHLGVAERNEVSRKEKIKALQDTSEDPGWTVTATFMEWLRTIIVKKWDGKARIHKWTSVGAAFFLLRCFCK
jgi:hypothetical protein